MEKRIKKTIEQRIKELVGVHKRELIYLSISFHKKLSELEELLELEKMKGGDIKENDNKESFKS